MSAVPGRRLRPLPEKIPIARLRPILIREIELRAKGRSDGSSSNGHGRYQGGFDALCHELAAWSGGPSTHDSWARRLTVIVNGVDSHGFRPPRRPDAPALQNCPKMVAHLASCGLLEPGALPGLRAGEAWELVQGTRREVTHVNFRTADRFLSALGLTAVWYDELADLYGGAVKGPVEERWCPCCRERTLGRVCLWCDTRTLPVAELVAADERTHDCTCAGCGRTVDWSDGSDLAVRVELGRVVSSRRSWSWWTLCALCFAESGPRRATSGRIPAVELLALYRAYLTKVGLERVLEQADVAARYGFANARAAAAAVSKAWQELGWPMFDRATSRRLNGEARLARGIVGGRVSADDLRRLHLLHMRGGVSANELARRTFERFGYASHTVMRATILHGWKALGLASRDRIEMTVAVSTKDGLSPRDWKLRRARRLAAGLTLKGKQRRPECAGTNARGLKCTRPAMPSGYCFSHDPALEQERRAQTAAMRARSPLSNRELVEWEPLRQELRAAYARLRSWEPLVEATGLTASTLRTYASDPHRRVSREKAEQFAAALAGLETVEEASWPPAA